MADTQLTDDQTDALREWIESGSRLRTLTHEAKQVERLEALRGLAAQHGELQTELSRLADVQAEYEAAAQDAEKRADELRKRVHRTDARLNDGTGLTSRDLMGLQEEIAGLRARIDEVEGEQVEALDAAETTEVQKDEAAARAEEVAGRGRTLQAERAREGQRLAEAIADIEGTMATQLDRIPTSLHSRLRGGGEYPPAAVVTTGSCGACGEQLSGMLADTYRNLSPGGMLDCDGCGTLLLKVT